MKRTQIKNISAQEIDSTFIISGWVERVRDHGGVIFFDIRDASGLMQVVVAVSYTHLTLPTRS